MKSYHQRVGVLYGSSIRPDQKKTENQEDTFKKDESSKIKGVSDVVKRIFAVGSSAAFLTEESIKHSSR